MTSMHRDMLTFIVSNAEFQSRVQAILDGVDRGMLSTMQSQGQNDSDAFTVAVNKLILDIDV